MTTPTVRERALVQGVPHESLVYGWDSSLRGLLLLLQHRGEAIGLDELSVLSGDAFHTCFATGPDTYPELIAPTDPLTNAARALGYACRWLITDSGLRGHLTPAVPQGDQRRALTATVLEQVYAQVDCGRPALVGGASHQGCGNWSLVVGYDRNKVELCHNGLDGEPPYTWSKIRGLAGPLNDRDGMPGYWNGRPRGTVVPGYHGGWLVNPVFVLGDRGEPPAAPEAARAVLRRAVELHLAGSVHFFGGPHYFGAAAYEQWLAAIPTMADPADLVLDEVMRGRGAAAAHCQRLARQFADAAAALNAAAAAYGQEVEVARAAFGDLVPFRWDNPARQTWGSQPQRQATAQALARMLEFERRAVAALEAALPAL